MSRRERAGLSSSRSSASGGPSVKTKSSRTSQSSSRHSSKIRHERARSRFSIYDSYYTAIIYFGLVIARVNAALYSNISDSNEVYNYWEPTHYLQYGYGMQTWEYSPKYAIRSWSYIKFHLSIAKFFGYLFNNDKIKIFYAMRLLFASICLISEFLFYRIAKNHLGTRVGRNILLISLLSVGMWNASTAYLPSTFAMYTTMIAYSYALKPISSSSGRRIYHSIFWTGFGSLLAWPFSAAIGIIPAIEEILIRTNSFKDRLDRLTRIIVSVIVTLTCLAIPIILCDCLYYKKLTIVPWNTIYYNTFDDKDRGPSLYGTEPWHYYFVNGFSNFNLIFLVAIISLPGLIITILVDPNRVCSTSPTSSPIHAYLFLFFRLAPLYLWLFLLSLRPHKEERFLYVIYPLICLNGSVSIFLVRGWIDRLIIYMSNDVTRTRNKILNILTTCFLVAYGVMSISRIYTLYSSYRAPMEIYKHLYYNEIPNNENYNHHHQEINLCLGKEWHRFPSHYFLPDNVRLRFLKSDFDGQLPKYFLESYHVDDNGTTRYDKSRDGTWKIQEGFNDRNLEETDRYVPIQTCDYIIDRIGENESNYAEKTDEWNKVICRPFFDFKNPNKIARSSYILSFLSKKLEAILNRVVPGRATGQDAINDFGNLKWDEYCLLKKIPGGATSNTLNNQNEHIVGFFRG
ncbi:2129_t:CDS:10, partial [Entrophospora sp. SA101]